MARRIEAAKAAGRVSLAVFVSRILGLVREQVLAAVFGASLYMDAWLVAFRVPNMLRDLFAEGTLSSAFIPTFTAVLKKEGRSEAWLLGSLILNLLLVILGLLAVVFLLFSDFFVHLLAGGYSGDPQKFQMTSNMVRILSPFLALVALASVVMGMLNALNHFFLPALAPACFNVSLILAGLFLVPLFERAGVLGIYAIAVGAVVGGLLQFLAQLPLLIRERFRYHLRLRLQHAGVLRVLRLVGPAIIGISAVQINVLVNTYLASLFGDGPVSWLSYAFRLVYLPIGLFGVAVGIVNLRDVSISAAQENWDELKETVANSIKLIGLLALPSMVGLMVLASPIIRIIYERGKFTALDTEKTALALICYSAGLFGYSVIKVYVPTFYTLNDTRTPVRISLIAVAVNLTVNLALVFLILPDGYEFAGLAFGTSVSVGLSSFLLALSFRNRLGPFASRRVGAALGKVLLASGVMGAAVALLYSLLSLVWPDPGQLELLFILMLVIGVGGISYLGLCRILGVEEVTLLLARLRSRKE